MATSIRRIHDAHFKTKVVLEALKGAKTLAQLSSEFGIHAQMITDWKRQALEGIPGMVVLNRTVFLLNFRRYGKSQQTNPAPSQVRQSLQSRSPAHAG